MHVSAEALHTGVAIDMCVCVCVSAKNPRHRHTHTQRRKWSGKRKSCIAGSRNTSHPCVFYAGKMSKLTLSASPGSVESHTDLEQRLFHAPSLDHPAWVQFFGNKHPFLPVEIKTHNPPPHTHTPVTKHRQWLQWSAASELYNLQKTISFLIKRDFPWFVVMMIAPLTRKNISKLSLWLCQFVKKKHFKIIKYTKSSVSWRCNGKTVVIKQFLPGPPSWSSSRPPEAVMPAWYHCASICTHRNTDPPIHPC